MGASFGHTNTPRAPKKNEEAPEENEALGRSQGGFSTKVHIRADGAGQPMALVLTPGQTHETQAFEALMTSVKVKQKRAGRPRRLPKRVVADKAYSSRKIRGWLRKRGVGATIPRKSNETRTGPFNKEAYRARNRVERLINRLKQNRRIATRYEKRAVNYLAMLTIAAILLWL